MICKVCCECQLSQRNRFISVQDIGDANSLLVELNKNVLITNTKRKILKKRFPTEICPTSGVRHNNSAVERKKNKVNSFKWMLLWVENIENHFILCKFNYPKTAHTQQLLCCACSCSIVRQQLQHHDCDRHLAAMYFCTQQLRVYQRLFFFCLILYSFVRSFLDFCVWLCRRSSFEDIIAHTPHQNEWYCI